MERVLKFRAWSFYNKEMYQDNSPYPAAYSFQIYGNGNIGYCPTFESEDLMSFYTDVDPENEKLKIAVMQYTGRNDKNGNEIYEGDILENRGSPFVRVEFRKGCFYLINDERNVEWSKSFDGVYFPHYKVVGNIYENPELLEPKKAQLSEPKVE